MGNDKGSKGISGEPDTTGWVKQTTGFAPYWSPEEGKSFIGRLVGRDERNTDFIRYVLECEQAELACHTGAIDSQVNVIVKKGDIFNVSVYAQLSRVFDEYMMAGIFPIVKVTAIGQVKTNKPGQTVWNFDLMVNPTDHQALEAHKIQIRSGRAIGTNGGTKSIGQ